MSKKTTKTDHLFSRETRPGKPIANRPEQAAYADKIVFRAVGVMEAEGVDTEVQMERLFAIAVALMQTHRGSPHAAGVLRGWADMIDPPPASEAPSEDN